MVRFKNCDSNVTTQKIKFFIKDFFSKCDQIHRKLRIWSHLLKKSLMEKFIFCAVNRTMWQKWQGKNSNFNSRWMLNIQYYSPIIESRHQRKVTLWLTLKSDHLQDIFQKKKILWKVLQKFTGKHLFFCFCCRSSNLRKNTLS